MNHEYDQDTVRAEYTALREETLSTINGRVWGIVTYIALAAGVAALYERTGSNALFVVLIFAALPFLWHTAVRERSRIRIGSYIKEVLERHSDLSWETYLAEWRTKFASSRLDRWRHIFGLTGVYVLIALFGAVRLFTAPASPIERGLAIVGILLCIEGHWYLNQAFAVSTKYDEAFRQIDERRQKSAM